MWKKGKILYWVSTGLLVALMTLSALAYLLQPDSVKEFYAVLGYPAYLIYFNAAAKILGSIAIVTPRFNLLKEWAYAGFAYILVLALLGHIMVGDPIVVPSVVGIVLLVTSYISYKKLEKQ